MNLMYSLPEHAEEDFFQRCVKKTLPILIILFVHAGFFYALKNGLVDAIKKTLPKEVTVSFIVPEKKAEIVAPPKVEPKVVPVVKHVERPTPTPVIRRTESPTAISAPETPPAPPAPPEPVVVQPTPQPAPVAPPTAPAVPKTITGVEYLRKPNPVYPAVSMRMGEEGTVIMRVLIDENGYAKSVQITKNSGSSRLDDAATDAVKKALFKPYMENGKPQSVFVSVPISFKADS